MNKLLLYFYGLLLIFITFFSYLFIDPNFIYLKNLFTNYAYQNRIIVTIGYIVSILLLFLFYFLFLQGVIKNRFTHKEGLQIIILTVILLLFAYPAIVSFDIFNYVATAKVLFHYHENPYLIMPIEFSGDSVLLFMHAANKIALYGFIWILLTGMPYVFGFGNFLFILFNFKVLEIIFYFGTLFVIWKLSKNIFSVYLFGLNPLIIFEILISAHNDIVMIFLVLLSFLFLKKKRIFLAILFFTLSIFIKYSSVFLIPVFFYTIFIITKNQKINWNKVFLFSALSMMFVFFFLSPIREEIYPWYAIWFLGFVVLVPQFRLLLYLSLAFSFSLLFRYVPFMLLGTYFGPTPSIKILVTFIPPLLVFIYYIIKRRLLFRK